MSDRFTETGMFPAVRGIGSNPSLAPAQVPPCFRLTSIERLPAEKGCRHRATLFHEQASLRVTWTSRQPDTTLTRGCLVSIRWCGVPCCEAGEIRVARLVRLDRPVASVNLFETIPSNWVGDRDLVRRARDLWEDLPRDFQELGNRVFWDGHRFQRYVMGPSSLRGHHNGLNGNFRHSVEVAEQALLSGAPYGTTFPPVLVLGGLLHDAGKADEYEYDAAMKAVRMSERGELIGHKHTVLEWIAAAQAQSRLPLSGRQYLALLHALTAAKGAPDWLGLREPRSLEATILSMADRLSGQGDLHRQVAPEQGGFGCYHKHLGNRPYVAGH